MVDAYRIANTGVRNLEDRDLGTARNKACLGTARPSYVGGLKVVSFSLSNI